MLKKHVIESCRYLLRPLVRFLLRHGVTWDEFGELSKDAYVHVAREEYGIQGRPTNNSRVAMLTGLSRREVARVRDRILDDSDSGDAMQGNQLSRVLSGWHTDPEFAGPDGEALELSTDSFDRLLSRYAGDLPHGAIRKEMLQRGLVMELSDGSLRVLKRDYVISDLDPAIVRQMGLAMHDHAATLEHNLDEDRQGGRRFEGMADNVNMSRKSAEKFCQLIEDRGFSFLEEIDGWLSQHEIDEDDDTRTVRLGVGVYLIHDESE